MIELEPRATLIKIAFPGQVLIYKIEAMITSLIEMLELPNFGHMATYII